MHNGLNTTRKVLVRNSSLVLVFGDFFGNTSVVDDRVSTRDHSLVSPTQKIGDCRLLNFDIAREGHGLASDRSAEFLEPGDGGFDDPRAFVAGAFGGESRADIVGGG